MHQAIGKEALKQLWKLEASFHGITSDFFPSRRIEAKRNSSGTPDKYQ